MCKRASGPYTYDQGPSGDAPQPAPLSVNAPYCRSCYYTREAIDQRPVLGEDLEEDFPFKTVNELSSIGSWLWARLPQLAGIFAIPWGFFFVSVVLTGWKKLWKTSGSDLFIILASSDLEFLLFRDRFLSDVYSGLRPNFEAVFVVALIVSFILLAWSSRVQDKIDKCGDAKAREFPSMQLFCCWALAGWWTAGHFAVVLIR